MDLRRVSLLCASLLFPRLCIASCILDRGSWLESRDWATCIQADLGLYGLGISDSNGRRTGAVAWSEGYASAFIQPWLSAHAKGYVLSNYQIKEPNTVEYQRTAEQAYLQIGHPLQGIIHGAVGRMPLPFGINDDVYRHALDSRAEKFWDRSVNGIRVSLRLRDDLRAELGGAWKESSTENRDALGFRLTKLVDLLSGTKLVASYQGRSDYSSHKMGLGSLVYNEENLSSLEWVRISANGDIHRIEQVFRFIHRQVIRPWAWDFGYEDLRKDSYRMSLGFQRSLEEYHIDNMNMGVSFHYERLREVKPLHQIYVLFGASYGWASSILGGDNHATAL